MESNEKKAPRPLEGLRVLEVAQNLAGPYCAQILADLGADVVKVESAGGDAARKWGPPFIDGVGSIFAIANRGKECVQLDLGSAGGREVLERSIRDSDVLIEALRPGAFARMGFDYERAREWNPRLIYCSVLAYGEEGPLKDLPGYDPLMQAHGGIMSVTGSGDARARVGTSLVDMGTGMWLSIAVLAALRERDLTGSGTRLSVALYDTALAWNAYHLAGTAATGFVPRPMGSELPMIAPYGAVPTTDGEIMIATANDGLFQRMCAALGEKELAADARFSSNSERVAHRHELNQRLHAATSQRRSEELLELLREAGVPCAPIQDMAQVLADPQTAASGMLLARDDGPAVPLPIRWNGVRSAPGAAQPPLE